MSQLVGRVPGFIFVPPFSFGFFSSVFSSPPLSQPPTHVAGKNTPQKKHSYRSRSQPHRFNSYETAAAAGGITHLDPTPSSVQLLRDRRRRFHRGTPWFLASPPMSCSSANLRDRRRRRHRGTPR